MSCGGKDLKYYIENGGRNALYMSHIAVVEFVEALGTWVEEFILRRLQNASYYSTTVEVLSLFCCWEENCSPVEH